VTEKICAEKGGSARGRITRHRKKSIKKGRPSFGGESFREDMSLGEVKRNSGNARKEISQQQKNEE